MNRILLLVIFFSFSAHAINIKHMYNDKWAVSCKGGSHASVCTGSQESCSSAARNFCGGLGFGNANPKVKVAPAKKSSEQVKALKAAKE